MLLRGIATALVALAAWTATPAAAQQVRDQASFGTWRVQKDGASLEMYAANDTGATVGVMCVDGQSCAVYVATRSRCHEGRHYSGIVGADGGFADFNVVCRIVGDRFVYVLSDFPRALRGLRDTRQWGIAIASADRGTQSFRFQLAGTHDAIRAMALIEKVSLQSADADAMF